MKRCLLIGKGDFHSMIEHCREQYPREACGLLIGRGSRVDGVRPLINVDPRSNRFWADPDEQLAAFREIEERGQDLLAIYHSHPRGQAFPSPTDRNLAYYPEALSVIIAGPPWPSDPTDGRVGAFGLADGQVTRVHMAWITSG